MNGLQEAKVHLLKTWKKSMLRQERLKQPSAWYGWAVAKYGDKEGMRHCQSSGFFSVQQRQCMSRMSSGSWTSLLSQEVLGKRSERINQTVKQVSHTEGCRRMSSPLLISAAQKQWTEGMHRLIAKEEMEPECLSQHFFFHLAFSSLILIIAMTFECLTWNGNGINSYHTYFCCSNIVALLTNLCKKMKGYLLRYNPMTSGEEGRRRKGTDKFV